ncbi:MAG: MerR family transcriptional regulator [Microbacterium gubbeenense]|uniref:MerR family transcriptional regulator n=1 Tax=Microbacterium gubbeenense TaxID=159896 RepID=UPI003F9E58DF
MAWSTNQLADLAGVTLRSIRHWHDVGLLPEPGRLSNGYKQYTARHLVLALRIARLTSLGFSLEHVAAMLDSEEQGQKSLHGLRTELDERIAELTRIRADIDALIARGISPDLSPEALLAMETLGTDPGSRNVAILLARLLPEEDMPAFADAMREAPDTLAQLNAEMLRLPDDTSNEQIAVIAEHGAALIMEFLAARGDALPRFDSRVSEEMGANAMTAIMHEHMNSAQQQVMTLIVERVAQLTR